jgi:hypothetical protein
MWNFLVALGAGSALGRSRTVRRVWKPLVALFFLGVLIVAFIYAAVVFKAVSERSNNQHVHPHSTH